MIIQFHRVQLRGLFLQGVVDSPSFLWSPLSSRLVYIHSQSTYLLGNMVLSEPLNAPYTRLGAIDAPTDTVNALAFSVDGRLLASAGDDRRVRVYDMDRGFSTFWEHEGLCAFTAVAWSDSVLFMGNMDGKIITFHPTKVSCTYSSGPGLIEGTEVDLPTKKRSPLQDQYTYWMSGIW